MRPEGLDELRRAVELQRKRRSSTLKDEINLDPPWEIRVIDPALEWMVLEDDGGVR